MDDIFNDEKQNDKEKEETFSYQIKLIKELHELIKKSENENLILVSELYKLFNKKLSEKLESLLGKCRECDIEYNIKHEIFKLKQNFIDQTTS